MTDSPILRRLFAATGNYRGAGVTFQNEKFIADLEITPRGESVVLRYRAPLFDETLTLTADTLEKSGESLPFVGRLAELGAKDGFLFGNSHQEFCLGFYANGDLGLRRSTRAPGGVMNFRTSARLKRIISSL